MAKSKLENGVSPLNTRAAAEVTLQYLIGEPANYFFIKMILIIGTKIYNASDMTSKL